MKSYLCILLCLDYFIRHKVSWFFHIIAYTNNWFFIMPSSICWMNRAWVVILSIHPWLMDILKISSFWLKLLWTPWVSWWTCFHATRRNGMGGSWDGCIFECVGKRETVFQRFRTHFTLPPAMDERPKHSTSSVTLDFVSLLLLSS